MALSYSQQINPIRSQIWCPFKEQHTELGKKVTNSYGRQSQIRYMQLGDGSTASTYPSLIGSKGFRFTGSQYITNIGTALTLGNAWSICMMIRPKLPGGFTDRYLVAFSNDGGIILNDSGESSELTYYDSTTTVSSGVALENDRFYSIIVTKDSSNNITFYINGEEEGSGIGTNSGFDLDYIGCDYSISSFYDGEIREFCVFDFEIAPVQASILNDRFVRFIEDQEFYFDPNSLSNLKLWADLDATDAVVRNTQPLIDGDMEAVGVGSWTAVDSTLSKEPGARTGGSGLQIIRVTCTSATYWAQQSGGIIGNQYNLSGWGRSSGVDAPRTYGGNAGLWTGLASTTWQDFDLDYSALSTALLFGSADSTVGAYSEFDDVIAVNLSIASITCKGALGNLAQSTATAMPWVDSTSGWIRFNTGDRITLSSSLESQRFLHDGTGCTMAFVINVDALHALNGVCGNSSGTSPASNGCVMYCTSTGTIRYYLSNTSGTYVYQLVSAASVIAEDTSYIVILRMNSASAEIRINGIQKVTQSATGSPNADNGTNLLNIGDVGGGGFGLDGTIADTMLYDRVLSATEVSNLEQYLATKHSITI